MRIEGLKLAKHLRQAIRYNCVRSTHRKRTAQLPVLMHSRLCFIRERKQPVSILKCSAANFRQDDIFGYTIEERSAKFTFESLNMYCHARLRIPKLDGGASKIIRCGNHRERFELQQVEHSNRPSSFAFKYRLQERWCDKSAQHDHQHQRGERSW